MIPIRKPPPDLNLKYIQDRIIKQIQKPVASMADLEIFLVRWWGKQYNRPHKDPLLLSYTLEELLVEFLDVTYRANPEMAAEHLKSGKINTEEALDEDWLKEMMGDGYASEEDQNKLLKTVDGLSETLDSLDAEGKIISEVKGDRHVRFDE